jgi:outer membrane protein insertion porin family
MTTFKQLCKKNSLIGALLFVCFVYSTQAFAEKISDIQVNGNQRVSETTIRSYLPLEPGDDFSTAVLDSTIDRLFSTSLFSNVDIVNNKGVVTITVTENPIINRVTVEGNDVLDTDILVSQLGIEPRRVYTKKVALDGMQKLLEIYQLSGRYGASVVPVVIELENNRIDLIFEVDEGPLIKITSVQFNGNERFSDRKLKQVISSRSQRWWAFLSSSDKYDENRLDYDSRLLRQFYLSRGYADINIKRARGGLLPDRSGFAISFVLEEGPLYQFDKIEIVSKIENINADELDTALTFVSGDRYDVRKLEESLLAITNRLGNLGYAFVNVSPTIATDPDNGLLNIKISVDPSRKNYVERIEIIDNSRTADFVIRREMQLVEGDAYNNLKLQQSIRNIRNLGFFRDVSVKSKPGSTPEQSVIEVGVEEQSTGNLAVGIGYSSIDQSSFSFGIDEKNFLGTGRAIGFSSVISSKKSDFDVSISEPFFLGRNLSASASVYQNKVKGTSVTIERRGFGVGFGFRAANSVYHNLTYNLAESETDTTDTTAASSTGEDGLKLLSSAVGYRLGIEKRDNRFDPTEGYFAEIAETYSGLGGDVTFLKSVVKGAYYVPISFERFVLGARAEAGVVNGLGENITQSNRFLLGGNKIRGFDGSGIGPRDSSSNAAVGGNQYYAGSFEIISDAGLNPDLGMRWTFYADYGSVWGTDYPTGVDGADDDSMRQSIGFGILWDTAIGPLSFYWADPISKQSYDALREFQFTIGTRL